MRPHEWQLQSAKAKFSELFELARTVGPQRVTRRGKDSVMVISAEEYERLCHRPTSTLYELIASSPLKGLDLDLERSQDVGRDVEL